MNVTALVFGAIFGLIFLITCVISAIKAVKDRKKIKERIALKQKARLENSTYDNISPENGNGTLSNVSNNDSKTTNYSNLKQMDSNSKQIDKNAKHSDTNSKKSGTNSKRVDTNSRQSQNHGHPNAYETNSVGEVVKRENRWRNRDTSFSRVPNVSSSVPGIRDDIYLHLDRTSAEKQIRRTSYAMAIDTHSWLPKEPPKYAKSKVIVETYKMKPGTKSFENKAFDSHDLR